MPNDSDNFEQRLRDLYNEVRSLRTVIDILRDEIVKTNHRVARLEGGVRPSLVPPHPERPDPKRPWLPVRNSVGIFDSRSDKK